MIGRWKYLQRQENPPNDVKGDNIALRYGSPQIGVRGGTMTSEECIIDDMRRTMLRGE